MTVRFAAIGDIAILNPKQSSRPIDDGASIPFIPMVAVSENGGTPTEERRRLADLKSGYTYFERGDILLAKITPCFENGKVAHLDSLSHPYGFGSTEFHVLRAGPELDHRYLYHAVRSPQFRQAGALRMTGSAGQQRVPSAFVATYRIRVPSLAEQRRIAATLDAADRVRRKRLNSILMVDRFLRAAFLKMFGDPLRNEKGWTVANLGEIAEFVGGGTPSRTEARFYDGEIPWASSKDITEEELYDTQEHVTAEAVERSATRIVAAGSILVVVKSKILLHRLPVAITRTAVCFNQDIKAIRTTDGCLPSAFIARHLRVGQQALLKRARGANTEGLTLEHLRNYRVMLPPAHLLAGWEQIEAKVAGMRSGMSMHTSRSADLFDSLAQQAYR